MILIDRSGPLKELRKEAIKRGVEYPFSEINELIQERDFIPITPPKKKRSSARSS